MEKSYYAIIPANVRYDKNLTANAKLLYGEITALCNEKGFCWANNKYFSELYGVSTTSVSKWISSLIEKGYIVSKLIYKENSREIDKRIISLPPLTNLTGGIEEILHTPIEEKLKDNNTYNNTIYSFMSETEVSDDTSKKEVSKFPLSPISSAGTTSTPKPPEKYIQKKKMAFVEEVEVPIDELKYFKTAEAFRRLFIKNQKDREAPTKHQEEATYKSYVDPIRLMMERDRVTEEQLRRAYERLKTDNFWKGVVLSTSKLRGQIDKLGAKTQQASEKPLEERKAEFKKLVIANRLGYEPKMLEEFFLHWSEFNHGDSIMRFEKEETFNVATRIKKWQDNKIKWEKTKSDAL